ncbi:hypothetical protein [Photobacterium angustum]|uniref:hypothetical protein n=1 Tax=Photobacterium angustum TaxID=661 RepID=UPI0005E9A3E8|nr:hypothetical protein [Photobacterium angustum]KJF99170.1 hypothetical protein UB35_20855 [Photobacterium angustum]PSV59916.1 hypothetical protein CTM95_21715 [Photobacterium angustum]
MKKRIKLSSFIVYILSMLIYMTLGIFLGIIFKTNVTLIEQVGNIGSFLGGLATCLAVIIAWKAKNEWFGEKNFDYKIELFNNMIELYLCGTKYFEFLKPAYSYQDKTTDELCKIWEIQAIKNLQDFDEKAKKTLMSACKVQVHNSKNGFSSQKYVNTIVQQAITFLTLTSPIYSERTESSIKDAFKIVQRIDDGHEEFKRNMIETINKLSLHLFNEEVKLSDFGLDTNYQNINQFIDDLDKESVLYKYTEFKK